MPNPLVGHPADDEVVADRGYDCARLPHFSWRDAACQPIALVRFRSAQPRLRVEAAACRAYLPPTRLKITLIGVAPALHRQRNMVERRFNRPKHARRIATRFDKLAGSHQSPAAIVATGLWTRSEART